MNFSNSANAFFGRLSKPVGGRQRQPKFAGDGSDTEAFRQHGQHSRAVTGETLWPSEFHALGLRRTQASAYPFLNDAALELGDGHQDIELQLAGRVQP